MVACTKHKGGWRVAGAGGRPSYPPPLCAGRSRDGCLGCGMRADTSPVDLHKNTYERISFSWDEDMGHGRRRKHKKGTTRHVDLCRAMVSPVSQPLVASTTSPLSLKSLSGLSCSVAMGVRGRRATLAVALAGGRSPCLSDTKDRCSLPETDDMYAPGRLCGEKIQRKLIRLRE